MREDWRYQKLGESCKVERGSSPRPIKKYITTDDEGVNWVKIGDVGESDKYVLSTRQKITKAGAKKSRFVDVGDFILSNSMSFGRPYIMKVPGYIHDGWFVLRLPEYINADYFWYLLVSPLLNEQFNLLAAGAVVKNISGDLVKKAKIPIPPLQEQQQIVAILDKAFTAIDQAKANIEKNIENAKELIQSKLNQIFSQESDDWEEMELGDLGTLTSSKRIYKKEYVTNGIPFYRSKEIKELGNDKEISLELFITEERYDEIKKKFGIPQKGDILLTAVGTIGEMYVVNENDKFYFKDGNIMWLKDFHSLNSYYLKYALTNFVEQLKAMSQGSAYSALTIEKLKKYSIPVPSLSEQLVIIDKLDQLRNKTTLLTSLFQNKLNSLEELKKSILQKAFAGELTEKEVAVGINCI